MCEVRWPPQQWQTSRNHVPRCHLPPTQKNHSNLPNLKWVVFQAVPKALHWCWVKARKLPPWEQASDLEDERNKDSLIEDVRGPSQSPNEGLEGKTLMCLMAKVHMLSTM
eukprot:275627-Amphidinium_carterae.1